MNTRGRRGRKKAVSVTVDDAFDVPRYIRKRLKECAEMADKMTREVTYLWIHVSEEGIAQPQRGEAPAKYPPALEEWLNVVDEAASVGVNWLMVTLNVALDAFPDLMEICKWAQDTYQMKVGLHTFASGLTPDEIELLKGLNLDLTRLFVRKDAVEGFRALEEQGIKIRVADPQPYGEKPNCQGASRLVFVDGHGVLYTCGLVEGNREYRLGSIHERSFDEVLADPNLPHAIEAPLHAVSRKCDGCPSLIANFLNED